MINVPIVHYSVEWWNTLHQGSSLSRFEKPAMPASMYVPLLEVALGTMLFYGWFVLARMRGSILLRERRQSWARAVAMEGA